MSLYDKYKSVLELSKSYNMRKGRVEERDGVLHIDGEAATQYHKDRLWERIREVGGEQPKDIEADITVAEKNYYHKHIVQEGDTLIKLARKYLGDPMKYRQILEANKTAIEDPDALEPGQELVIPNV